MMKNIVLGFILVIGFFLYYFRLISTRPFQYYDEAWWIGDSYFFDLLLHDRGNPVWNSTYAYDQPKLVHYVFGMGLYPSYLAEKRKDASLSYVRYISNIGLLCRECIGREYLPSGASVISREQFEARMLLPEFEHTQKSIIRVRIFNAGVAAFTVMVVYLLGTGLWGSWWGFVFAVWYGMNSLVIRTVLPAHAEALLLFFYSTAVLSLYWFIQKRSASVLSLFSVCVGFAASVKLSGFVLIPLCVLIILFDKRSRSTRNVLMVLAVPLVIFALLNPQVQPFLFPGLIKMIEQRNVQQAVFSAWFTDDSLPGISSRILSVLSGFFGFDSLSYSAPIIVSGLPGRMNSIYGLLFCVGLVATFVRKVGKNFFFPLFTYVVFFGSLVWLTVRWDRYYVLLVLPILAIQLEGFRFIWDRCATKPPAGWRGMF